MKTGELTFGFFCKRVKRVKRVRKRRGGQATGTDLKVRHYKSREEREKSREETERGKGIAAASWLVEARQ
jgi:hypothetical protein